MSLFIDVPEALSRCVKSGLIKIIANEQKKQERPVRKICETCIKYLDYGELRYDKMEDGIDRLKDTAVGPLSLLLSAIMQESLDEDKTAVSHFEAFSSSALAEPLRQELHDFITAGRFVTLHETPALEQTGLLLIERYTDAGTITETLSNLYIKAEAKEFLPVFIRLLDRAKELYPDSLQLEGFSGFIHLNGELYDEALMSFMTIKDKLEQDTQNRFYNYNLASAWDNIALCYLKQGEALKARESCNMALSFDEKSEDYTVGKPLLYKKAEACLLLGDQEQAGEIVGQLLLENEEDEMALELQKRITTSQ
jgi:tetratricopeptide (TPR) repeat protein